jgi:microcystin-dependent protein
MEVFLGSIWAVPYNFAPKGFAFCQGQIMAIQTNTALFALLGTYYGGNGMSTFGLPNLQGITPIGMGQGPGLSSYAMGETGGVPSVTLIAAEMPAHTHQVQASNASGTSASPAGNVFSSDEQGAPRYAGGQQQNLQLAGNALQAAGNSQPHENRMPYQGINWIIALQGIFPPRT